MTGVTLNATGAAELEILQFLADWLKLRRWRPGRRRVS